VDQDDPRERLEIGRQSGIAISDPIVSAIISWANTITTGAGRSDETETRRSRSPHHLKEYGSVVVVSATPIASRASRVCPVRRSVIAVNPTDALRDVKQHSVTNQPAALGLLTRLA
jgi:hypothetical protein